MKKLLCILTIVVVSPWIMAQTTTRNYIKSTTFQVGTTTGNVATDEKIETINYFDGLGRPLQRITKQAGGNKQDIITPFAFDYFGRQIKDYLPYARTASSLNFETNLIPDNLGDIYDPNTFYATKYPEDFQGLYPEDVNSFSEKYFEASPLNRLRKQGAPGAAWKMNKFSDTDHTIKLEYNANSTSDNVKHFKVSFTNEDKETPYLENQGIYTDLQLYKTITKDENWTSGKNNTTEEFKDKEGHVILKRSYSDYKDSNGQLISSQTPHDTYYVYDRYGNLTYVLPPKVTGTIDNEILNGLCYQYKYDYRNRLVEKKLPGKQWEFIVYDKLDRPVLTQDGNLRKTDNLWQFTKYDPFGRVAYTGIYPNVDPAKNARAAMQNYFDTQNNTGNKMYESRVPGAVGGGYSNISYTSDNFPKTSLIIYTINYYDNYDFYTFNKDGITLPATTSSGDNIINYNNAANTQLLTKGLLTGTKIRILDSFTTTNYWITEAIGYDAKARPIYTVKNNKYLSTIDIVESKLDFAGKTDKTIRRHTRGNTKITIEDLFAYDHAARLIKQTQSINGATPPEVILVNTYDELGQLISKKVGGKTTQELQHIDYTYNIRGWLTGINNDVTNNLVLDTSEKDLFSFKINYNNTAGNVAGVKALYNGNIAETYWRTASDNILRKYGYEYDNLNRLKNAIYQNPEGNTYPAYEDYSEKDITYDKNGNIETLYRNGDLVNALPANLIDDLHYSYKPSSNILTGVYDASNNTSGFKDGNLTGDDYSYDDNGNLTADKNKEITNISYNCFNLPTEIIFRNDNYNTIRYIYDALGTKQKKIVFKQGDRTETCYAGNFQYVQYFEGGLPSVLKFFGQPEGYVESNGSSFKYVYQYKDHLGNVRLSYSDANNDGTITNSEIIEENNYYPFGLQHEGYNNTVISTNTGQKYKYNGKELQDELNLNVYNYGARNYDPAIGRWMNIDPLAEKHLHQTPYLYCNANPVIFMDPDGKDGIIVIKGGQITISSKIYLYGDGATKSVVSQMQKDINKRWGETFNSKSLDGKQSFKVNVKVKVGLYEGKEKNNPMIISESWDINNRDNFIEVSDNVERSFVNHDGDEGKWKSTGRKGKTLAEDDSAPHELGHLLGLIDRYTDEKGANEGWGANIMANGSKGKVQQRNIDGILFDAMKAYDEWSKDKNNEGKEFRYEINNRPNK